MEGWPGAKIHVGRFLKWDSTPLQGHGLGVSAGLGALED